MKLHLRYIHTDRDRHGNVRVYFKRPGGAKTRIREQPGSPEFFEAYRALLDGTAPSAPAQPAAPEPGSWRAFLDGYFASAAFRRGLGQRTRYIRRLILDATCDEPLAPGSADTFGQMPVARMGVRQITVLRDRKADETPGAANERLKAIRQALAWRVEAEKQRGRHAANPALDVPYIRTATGGWHSWTLDEVERYEAAHPVGTRARLALALLLYTGCRRSDVIVLGRQHVRGGPALRSSGEVSDRPRDSDGVNRQPQIAGRESAAPKQGWLHFTEAKGKERHPKRREIPILPELQAILDATPCAGLTFIESEIGRPFSHGGFGNRFRKWCDEAGLPAECSAHGLRKAGAALAAENGATAQQLMAIFGWSTLKEAERYTRAASLRKLVADGMPLLARRG